MHTVKFFTLGCKVNQYETEAIREGLISKGLVEVNSKDHADVYIINTCTVTGKADSKSRDLIKKALQENPNAKVIVTGCSVDNTGNSFANDKRIITVKNELKNRISDILDDNLRIFDGQDSSLLLSVNDFKGHNRAFVKVQDGCDNSCSYCIIPTVRGGSRSRYMSDIVDEAKRLLGRGFQEIVLTGICLGAYGKDLPQNYQLADVVEAILELKGRFRIRLSSIEAKDVSNRIIELIAVSPKLCRHLHIPFQSGDDAILKKMNRNYTADDYLSLIKKIRVKILQIAITTDVMVGFPSENEENFTNTFNFLKEVSPSRMHIFPFSPRPKTAAYSLAGRVPGKIIRERIEKLKSLARQASLEYRSKFLNKEVEVLVEGQRSRFNNYLQGYTDNYINVLVNCQDDFINNIVRLKITEVRQDSTIATPI